jgi:hypothetical protein
MEIFDELLKRHMSLPEVLHMVRSDAAFNLFVTDDPKALHTELVSTYQPHSSFQADSP